MKGGRKVDYESVSDGRARSIDRKCDAGFDVVVWTDVLNELD